MIRDMMVDCVAKRFGDPVESPESNGMAEAFVKTFKRDYAIPNAAAALALIDRWMEDYNTVHPHSRLGYR